MVALSELLDAQSIQLEMQASRKKEAIAELVDCLARAGKVKDAQAITNELLAQERTASTGIGEGIAIPHVLLPTLSRSMLAFGRHKQGIGFDAIDRRPVFLVFLLLGPRRKPTEHLQILSKLSRLLHDQELRQGLFDAATPEDVLAVLRRYEAE